MIMHHAFIKTAKKFGKKVAIVDRTTNSRVPYSKALIASLILAKKIKAHEEKYIGIMVPTTAGCMLATLGTLMAGKIPVMINYSTGAENNCRYAQNKIGFKTILTSGALLEKINCPLVEGMICLEDIMKGITTGDKLGAALKSILPPGLIIKSLPPADIDDTLVILFTSGSEKDPKAVQLTHRNIGSNVNDAMPVFRLTSDDVILSELPMFHSFGQTVDFWLPITQGMTAVAYANPLDYKTIPTIVREEKVTMIAATPIFFGGYLKESKEGDFQTTRIMVAGADKCPDWLRDGYKKKHNIILLEGYGTTETSPVVSANTPWDNKPGSIGKPFPSVQVKITDISTGKDVGTDTEGKILVKGDIVMKGYYGDIEETALHIKDGWYDTGDMGVIDSDGYIWHRGRLKRFVKIGGEMVSLVKSECALEDLLPDGVSCCVVDVPDPKKGARLIAAITEKVDEKELRKKLGKELPPINVPSQFMVFEELPKMGSGKVDFRTITDMVRQRAGK